LKTIRARSKGDVVGVTEGNLLGPMDGHEVDGDVDGRLVVGEAEGKGGVGFGVGAVVEGDCEGEVNEGEFEGGALIGEREGFGGGVWIFLVGKKVGSAEVV